mmetsp:Transcript_45988/g.96550  ORF Transcript_45988/g.96550 Transcript_45988/m.96550 type:complete len:95 (-) Transcript_45988:229-513(-)
MPNDEIILSNSFAHLVTRGNNSMAYLTERVGMQEGIKQMLEAKLGRISVRRTSHSGCGVLAVVDSRCIDLDIISTANAIPSEHIFLFHDLTKDK